MPWTTADVDKFNGGLTQAQKRQWVAVANQSLADCQRENGSNCEERAIRQANAAVKQQEGNVPNENTHIEVKPLTEAANVGEWLESRLHMRLTVMADEMYGEGRLTREERKALSAAIGDALDAYHASLQENVPHLFQRSPWDEVQPGNQPAGMPMAESVTLQEAALGGEFVPLVEKAVRRDGTIPIRVIRAGWGASGFYPQEVLQRDGPQAFRAGTKMLWDHPTPTEEAERPEGSLQRLAAELVEDARWEEQGPDGPGLYASAKVFTPYKEAVDELAEHIGVSIRALGQAHQGEMEGRQGRIVDKIVAGKGIDFVTSPGAGGKIVQLFEAAGRQPQLFDIQGDNMSEQETQTTQQLQEAQQKLQEAQTENQRLRERLVLRDAKDAAQTALAKAVEGQQMPDMTRQRLTERANVLAGNPPTDDGKLDEKKLTEAIETMVKEELEYLTQIGGQSGGRITGMGGGNVSANWQPDLKEAQSRLDTAMAGLGYGGRQNGGNS